MRGQVISPARLALAQRAAPWTAPIVKPRLPGISEEQRTAILARFRAAMTAIPEPVAIAPQFPEGQGCDTYTTHMRAAFREAVTLSKPELRAAYESRKVSGAGLKSKGQIGNAAGRAKQTRVHFSHG